MQRRYNSRCQGATGGKFKMQIKFILYLIILNLIIFLLLTKLLPTVITKFSHITQFSQAAADWK